MAWHSHITRRTALSTLAFLSAPPALAAQRAAAGAPPAHGDAAETLLDLAENRIHVAALAASRNVDPMSFYTEALILAEALILVTSAAPDVPARKRALAGWRLPIRVGSLSFPDHVSEGLALSAQRDERLAAAA